MAVGAALQATALDRILSRSGRISAQSPSQSGPISNQFPVETESTSTGVMDVPKEVTRTAVGAQMPKEVTRTAVAAEALRPETTETGVGEQPRPPAFSSAPPNARTVIAELEGNAPRGEYKVNRPPSDVYPAQSQPIGRMAKPPPAPPTRPAPSTAPGMASQPPPPPAPRGRPNRPSAAPFDLDGPSPASTLPRSPPPPAFAAPTMVAQMPPQQPAMQPRPVAPPPAAPAFQQPQTFPVMPVPAPAPAPPPAPEPMAEPYRASPVILDVTPRSLGIGTVAGYCEELIRRNSRIPAQMRKTFTTIRDNQNVVQIVVCQGESRRLDDNVVLGDLRLEGLPERPRGETSIEVTFELDASGILNVRARDVLTNQEQRVELDVVGTLPEEEIAGARSRLKSLTR